MILVVPKTHCELNVLVSPSTEIRRYFEQRFRFSEIIQVSFTSKTRCCVKVIEVRPAQAKDGHPISEHIEHKAWYDVQEGWGKEVMEVIA